MGAGEYAGARDMRASTDAILGLLIHTAPSRAAAKVSAPREDGNDVNLDRQMARLAQNTLYNATLVQLLASRFATVKQAISGRV